MNNFEQIKELLKNSKYYYIIITDMAGNYSYINENYAAKFLNAKRNITEYTVYNTMHADDIDACIAAGIKSLTNPNILVPATIRKHDGKGGYVITQWEFKGVFDCNGNPEGVFCMGNDITEFIEKIGSQHNLLGEIAFSQSHIIRRPVANILGAIEMIKTADTIAEVKELLEMLYESTAQLDTVIREVTYGINSAMTNT